MTDYYVNTATGNDTNNGTASGTPWKNIVYAVSMATNADTIYITSTITNPCRTASRDKDGTSQELSCSSALVGSGTAKGCTTITLPSDYQPGLTPQISFVNPAKAFITGTIDISPGSTWDNNGYINLDLDSWDDPSTLTGWDITLGGAGTITQETTEVHTAGGSSCACFHASGGIIIERNLYLPEGSVTFSYWHKSSTSGAFFPKHMLWDKTNSLFWNGSEWVGVSTYINGTHSTSWREETETFTVPEGGIKLELAINSTEDDATNIVYLDDITFTPASGVNDWTSDTGNVYYLPSIIVAPNSVCACTTAEWNSHGTMALMYYINAGSLATCRTTPYSRYYDATNDYLYINTGGTAIANMHVEMSMGGSATGITIADAAADMSYIQVTGGGNAIKVNAASTILDCVSNGGFNNMLVDGVAPSVKYCFTYFGEEGFITDNAGSGPVYTGCTSFFNVDDGFQSLSGGHYYAYSCVSKYNGFEGVSDNTGFSCEGASAGMTIVNCTAAYNAGIGIRNSALDAGSPRVTTNCISYGNSTDIDDSSGTAGTVTNNIYETYLGTDISGSNTAYDPDTEVLFASAIDLSLGTGSIAYNQATENATIKTDVRKRPRGSVLSIGAFEPSSRDRPPVARTTAAARASSSSC